MPPARERPIPGDAIAALHRDGAGIRAMPHGEDGPPIVKDLGADLWIEQYREHGAHSRLAQAPGGAGIGLGDLLHHLEKNERFDFLSTECCGQQETEQPSLMQRGDEVVGQPATAFDLVGRGGDIGNELAGGFERGRRRDNARRGGFLQHVYLRGCQVTSEGSMDARSVGSMMSSGVTALGMRLMLSAQSLR